MRYHTSVRINSFHVSDAFVTQLSARQVRRAWLEFDLIQTELTTAVMSTNATRLACITEKNTP